MMTFIWFVVIFCAVVISHEFGHFLLAKANGIRVVEFFVGMGPTLASFERGGTKYSLKLLPIGGACMFEGEDGLNAPAGDGSGGSFQDAPVWSRISTVLAGPFFNFILAFLLALVFVNMAALRDPYVEDVVEDGAAAKAGLIAGDRILSLNGEKVHLYEEISIFCQLNKSEPVTVLVDRDGQRLSFTLTPGYSAADGRYYLGITNAKEVEIRGLNAFRYAWYEVRYSAVSTYKSLKMLVQGKVGRQDVAGPVGIAVNVVGKTYDQAKEYGWQTVLVNMLNIAMLLSVNLGILNLLPIPALDGGRLVFLLIELVRGKPVPPEREGMVHFVGMMFFFGLMIFIFFNDLVNIFAG